MCSKEMFAHKLMRCGLLALAAIAMMLAVAGCRAPWGVRTRYTIQNIEDVATRNALQRELKRFGMHVINNPNSRDFVFELTQVRTVSQLRYIQLTIQSISKRSKIPVAFTEAHLFFQSVFGTGMATIYLQGYATPGASVYIDAGGGLITPKVEPNGTWSTPVDTTIKLRERDGWIYVLTTKDRVKQYVKISVIDTTIATKIRPEELPSDSPLRQRF